ncbi:signal peptide protein [Rhodopirellula sallentina SM41]|uniref:Signal peptide protein n=2 Tax=Rhodopirellula TaxID=265488 RepID=M5UDJ2_9BACT|nr:signal peptide protein [Rhodopirellula sallentina SM41]
MASVWPRRDRSIEKRGRADLVWVVAVAAVWMNGCGTSERPSESGAVSRQAAHDVDAQTRLREVFGAYQASTFYEDDGEVVIRSPRTSGSGSFANQQETAPLRVRLDPRQLAVDAYTARIRVSAGEDVRRSRERLELIAWFNEPETSHFDAQVLVQRWDSSPEDRLRLENVLRDEVLRSRVSAGLAGPPPQLEWLLADRPMKKLFTDDSRFEWLDTGEIDGVELQRIAVTSDRERFVFWIHPVTNLIRRVELPVPPSIGDQREGWELFLELRAATFLAPVQGFGTGETSPQFESRPRFREKWVGRFVPVPPPPPSPLLGKEIRIEELMTAKGVGEPGVLLESRFLIASISPEDSSDRPAWMAEWGRMLPALNTTSAGRMRFIALSSHRDVAQTLRQYPSSLVSVVDPAGVSGVLRKLRLSGGAFAVLSTPRNTGAPAKLLLVENESDPGSIQNAIAVIRDSQSGIDVPKKIREDYESLVRDYESALRTHRLPSN